MKRFVAAAFCGWLFASACSLDWDTLDPRLGEGAGAVGGASTTGGGGATSATGGGASVGGGGLGGPCTVDEDCPSDAFCGCASIGVVGVAENSELTDALTLSTPIDVASGDVMIAAVAVRPDNATATAPAGWTLIRLDTSDEDVTENLYSFYRVVEADEVPSHTWTFSQAHTGAAGGIIAFRGVDAADPIDAHDGQAIDESITFDGLGVEAPSVTATTTESMVITVHAATSSGSWQPPPAMSESVEVATHVASTSGESLLMSHAPQAMAGDSGVKTAVVARHDGANAVSQTIALRSLCTSGSCTPQQLDGWTCTADTHCQSGICTNNHCCDSACGGACDACDIPNGLGTCSAVPASTSGAPTCEPYACNGALTTCPAACTSTLDCAGGFYCNGSDSCVPVKSNGQTCANAGQCQSGKCVDGRCCNSDCGGACRQCNLAGSEGTCSFRPAGATGSPSCSPYVCSGSASPCPTTCSVPADCATGFTCMGGSCI